MKKEISNRIRVLFAVSAVLAANVAHGQHFYTTDVNGEQAKQAGYSYEKVAGYVYAGPNSASVPMYR